MGLRRYANKRDANEGGIISAFEALGCLVYPQDKPCDLLVGCRGVVLLVEVKGKRGKLTREQAAFHANWPVHVVRSVDDAIALVQGTRRAA